MKLIAAVVQMTSGGDLTQNLSQAEALIAEATRHNAELTILPENFALLADDEKAKLAVAEPIPGDGKILTAMRDAARRHRVALILGGLPERSSSGRATHVHNTCVYLDRDGALAAVYR